MILQVHDADMLRFLFAFQHNKISYERFHVPIFSLIVCYLEASRGKASYFMVQRTRVMSFIVLQLLHVYMSLIRSKDA